MNGIDMQAISQPLDIQQLTQTVFSTAQSTQVKYKGKYTTTYDMTILANNIKTQKAVPLYELDEKLYQTIKEIFVQQSPPAEKTAGIDTNDTPPLHNIHYVRYTPIGVQAKWFGKLLHVYTA